MSRSSIRTIIKKEILDAIRDGKSMATALLMPVIFAIISFGSTSFLVTQQTESTEIELAIQGSEKITPLVAHLKMNGIKVVDAPDDPQQAILDHQYHMVLVVSEDFETKFRSQKRANLDLLSDHSRTESQGRVHRVKSLINQWAMGVGALRLLTRNVSPEIVSPVNLNEVNVTSAERLASRLLAGLPMFILMIAFASGLGMIADMASGERERRSLEPLLINPVSHTSVFLGKWWAAFLMTTAISAVGIILQFISIQLAPTEELGLRLDMGVGKFFIIMMIVIPIIAFAVALQLFISFFAKSFKDAQSYNGLVIMMPMVPGLYLTFNSGAAELWQMWVPILGPNALIVDIIAGDPIQPMHFLIATSVSCVCAVASGIAGVTLLKQERTVFG